MTTLTYGHSTQHAGANRLTSGLAALATFFRNWASVTREWADAGRDRTLSPRAQRLLRAGY